MELAQILKVLWHRRLWVAGVVCVALLGAVLTTHKLSLFPPGLEQRSLSIGVAQGQVLIDSPRSSLVSLAQDPEALAARAKVYAQFLASATAKRSIADESGLPFNRIRTEGPFSTQSPGQDNSARPRESRAAEVLAEGGSYRLLSDVAHDELSIVSIYAEAPSADEAERLASSAIVTLRRYVLQLENETVRILDANGKASVVEAWDPALAALEPGADQNNLRQLRVTVRVLGAPAGAVINEGMDTPLMLMTFIGILVAGCILILAVVGIARGWGQAANEEQWAHPLRDSSDGDWDAADLPAASASILSLRQESLPSGAERGSRS